MLCVALPLRLQGLNPAAGIFADVASSIRDVGSGATLILNPTEASIMGRVVSLRLRGVGLDTWQCCSAVDGYAKPHICRRW